MSSFSDSFSEHSNPPSQNLLSSFAGLNNNQMNAHVGIKRYGNFLLTDAVSPSYDLKVTPKEGLRYDVYHDKEAGKNIPVLMAAVSQEKLFGVFLDLLDPLGDEVDVVLETSHQSEEGENQDLYREAIDLPVLKSVVYDFEDMLMNDGCTGIAVLNPKIPFEVQFDEHKLFIIYGQDLFPFEMILRGYGVLPDEAMKFITEAEHVHSTSEDYKKQFEELAYRLNIEDDFDDYSPGF